MLLISISDLQLSYFYCYHRTNTYPITPAFNKITNTTSTTIEKLYLAVPISEKDEVKSLGAKWDNINKKWFTTVYSRNNQLLLEKWKINNTPVDLIGEDRNFGGNELFVDLIPQTCWFSNVRTCIHPSDWDRVRNYIYERTTYTCECCGVKTKDDISNGRLEAHERWEYDETNRTQKLKRLIALCHQCHQATHIGRYSNNIDFIIW